MTLSNQSILETFNAFWGWATWKGDKPKVQGGRAVGASHSYWKFQDQTSCNRSPEELRKGNPPVPQLNNLIIFLNNHRSMVEPIYDGTYSKYGEYENIIWKKKNFTSTFQPGCSQKNPKGWLIDTLLPNHLAPLGRSSYRGVFLVTMHLEDRTTVVRTTPTYKP